jgi:hypothetical protein
MSETLRRSRVDLGDGSHLHDDPSEERCADRNERNDDGGENAGGDFDTEHHCLHDPVSVERRPSLRTDDSVYDEKIASVLLSLLEETNRSCGERTVDSVGDEVRSHRYVESPLEFYDETSTRSESERRTNRCGRADRFGRHTGSDPSGDLVAGTSRRARRLETMRDSVTSGRRRAGLVDESPDRSASRFGERSSGSAVELDGEPEAVSSVVSGALYGVAASFVDSSVLANEERVGDVGVAVREVVALIGSDSVVARFVAALRDGDSGPMDRPSGRLSRSPRTAGSRRFDAAPFVTRDDLEGHRVSVPVRAPRGSRR